MKKNVFMKKLGIAAIVLIVSGLAILGEYGIANLFDIHIMGMTYKEYALYMYHQYPWAAYVEILLAIATVLIGTNQIYKDIESILEAKRMRN